MGDRVVCFDWGGVLLRICRSWAEGCAAAGLDVRGQVQAPELVTRRRAISEQYQIGRMSTDEYAEAMSRAMGGVYLPSEVLRVHDAWLIEEYPGVDRVVAELHATRSVRTALLSNTNALHWERHAPSRGLRHFPTAGSLHHPHASHLMGRAKPGLEIYREFESLVGVRGASIIFFDDLPENIAAAQSLGWHAVRIDHEGDTATQIRAALGTADVLPPR
ncbi:MAG: HAD-IA family hydrolase [Phycisphaerae bacterium]|nr:HAD-IA family hydrolase [Phycisphaerae bacterium]